MSALQQRDRCKNIILNTLAVAPVEGIAQGALVRQLLATQGTSTQTDWQELRGALDALVTEGSVVKYLRRPNDLWIRKTNRASSRSRPTSFEATSSSSVSPHRGAAAINPTPNSTPVDPISEREWKRAILSYIDREGYASGQVLVNNVIRSIAGQMGQIRFNKEAFSAVMSTLQRDGVLEVRGSGDQQTVRKTPRHSRAAQVETIDLTEAVDDALESKPRAAGVTVTPSQSAARTMVPQSFVKSESFSESSFSESKQHWTRRRMRELCGNDEARVFEVLRLVIPSLRTTQRRNLRIDDISHECLKKVYRYLRHCELELPKPAYPTAARQLAAVAQLPVPQADLEAAVMGASNKQLSDTLLELCKLSPSLSRAVMRGLEPNSKFSTSTLRSTPAPGRPISSTPEIKREPSVKLESGIRPNAERGPGLGGTFQLDRSKSISTFFPTRPTSSMARIKSESAIASASTSTQPMNKPSHFRLPPIVLDDDSNPSTPNHGSDSDSLLLSRPTAGSSSKRAVQPEANTSGASKRPVTRVKCTRCQQNFDPADNRSYDCRKHIGVLTPDWDDPYWLENGISSSDGITPNPDEHPGVEFTWSCCGHPSGHLGCQKVAHEEA